VYNHHFVTSLMTVILLWGIFMTVLKCYYRLRRKALKVKFIIAKDKVSNGGLCLVRNSSEKWREYLQVWPFRFPVNIGFRHTISNHWIVSHAISDLAGRYANCTPSFGGSDKIRVYVGAAAFSRGVCIRHGLARTEYLRSEWVRWALPFITMTWIVPLGSI